MLNYNHKEGWHMLGQYDVYNDIQARTGGEI
ncbi:MAG: hypothetical protein K0R34_3939, partial [Herbinix sp.]|nr:hypothetical protein [Herbinix sp.]